MRSLFLFSLEKTFVILFGLGLSKANVIAYVEAISGFCFYGRQIRKSSFAKVSSWKLNKNYGSLLAEQWICIIKRQPEAGVLSLLLNTSFIAIKILNSANSSAFLALGLISVLNGSLSHKTCNMLLLKYNRSSAERISRCSMMQVLMLSGNSISFHFQALFQQ